jgi:hypothetical protein
MKGLKKDSGNCLNAQVSRSNYALPRMMVIGMDDVDLPQSKYHQPVASNAQSINKL